MKRLFFNFILDYLRFWARLQLSKLKPTIIGITGSNGKTSAMSAVEAVLTSHRKIKVSHKANSEIGLPLDILDLKIKYNTPAEWFTFIVKAPLQVLTSKQTYDIYIAEMGVDSPFPPQNMGYLLTFLKPTIGIFLNARAVHTEPYQPLAHETDPAKRKAELIRLIATEKGKMIEALPKGGTAILNSDDPNVKATVNRTQTTTLFFGKDKNATLQIVSVVPSLEGTIFTYRYQDEKIELFLEKQLLPHHYAYSIASALLAGITCGLTLEEAKTSFEKNFHLPPGRSTLIEGINNSLILDSSYNAATQSTIDSLELLKLSNGRKLALLGDIRELGEVTQVEHELVAQKAAEICDEVFLVGPYMQSFALPILEKRKLPVTWFENSYLAGKHIKQILKKDDFILVKASQNTLLFEIAIEQIMAHPEEADKLLCRREPFWDKKRAEIISLGIRN